MNFSQHDKSILREGMDVLQFWEKQILIYRFWENLSIEEIALIMEMSWSQVDASIESSFIILRIYCLTDQTFSLSRTIEEAA